MAYSYFGCCENHKFNLFHSISSSLRDIVQASLAFHSSVQPKYVMDNLVICENRVNTHTHIRVAEPIKCATHHIFMLMEGHWLRKDGTSRHGMGTFG